MKRFTVSFLLFCLALCVKAQKMEDFFVKMPDDMVVQLEEAWRKDLVDLYKSGKTATLENTMQGKSTLSKLTEDYMLLKSTEYSTIELKLLPLVNNTYIICMIETVYAPVADSRVIFYTTEWQRVPSDGLFTPVVEEWFWKEDHTSLEFLDAKSRLDMYLVKYSLSEEDMILTAEYTTPQYLDEEYQGKVEPFLKTEPKIYEWKSGRFE
ncbi:MAG: DUF3256 family protein [Tannerella sp.]|jgi:hypothetical protein|nr:DUF3256 family protein [Tannerella sp.]